MSLPVRLVALGALAVLLSGCAPTPADPTPTPPAQSKPTVSATPAATPTPEAAAPETVDPANFLLDGTPGTVDADGFWKGHYGFYTDASKAVRCDLWIFSGDSGAITCAVTPGNEGLVTYSLPPTDCQAADGNAVDGYSVGINAKVFPAGTAGFTGCGAGASDFAGATPVLKDNQTLTIDHDSEQFSCTVAAGVASCTSAGGASIRFGLGVAEFQG